MAVRADAAMEWDNEKGWVEKRASSPAFTEPDESDATVAGSAAMDQDAEEKAASAPLAALRAELLLGLDHPPSEAELPRSKRRCCDWPPSSNATAFLVVADSCADFINIMELGDDGCESMAVEPEQPRTPEDRLVSAFLDRPYLASLSESRLFPRGRLEALRLAAAERGAIVLS